MSLSTAFIFPLIAGTAAVMLLVQAAVGSHIQDRFVFGGPGFGIWWAYVCLGLAWVVAQLGGVLAPEDLPPLSSVALVGGALAMVVGTGWFTCSTTKDTGVRTGQILIIAGVVAVLLALVLPLFGEEVLGSLAGPTTTATATMSTD